MISHGAGIILNYHPLHPNF